MTIREKLAVAERAKADPATVRAVDRLMQLGFPELRATLAHDAAAWIAEHEGADFELLHDVLRVMLGLAPLSPAGAPS